MTAKKKVTETKATQKKEDALDLFIMKKDAEQDEKRRKKEEEERKKREEERVNGSVQTKLPIYLRGRRFCNACMDYVPYPMGCVPEGLEAFENHMSKCLEEERLKASPEIVKKFNQTELSEVVWDTSQGFKYDSKDSIPLICWAYGIKAEDFLKGYLKKSDLPTAKELEELETRLYEEIFKYHLSSPPESYFEARNKYLEANDVYSLSSLFKFYAAYLIRVLIPLMREAIIQSENNDAEKLKAKKEQERNEIQKKIQEFQEQVENLKSQLSQL